VEFLADAGNRDEAVKLGLVKAADLAAPPSDKPDVAGGDPPKAGRAKPSSEPVE